MKYLPSGTPAAGPLTLHAGPKGSLAIESPRYVTCTKLQALAVTSNLEYRALGMGMTMRPWRNLVFTFCYVIATR
jgi:hypothetical protein